MQIRRYTSKDYGKLCDWLDALDWPIIPKESIPPYGIVICEDGVDLAISFIYVAEEPNYDFINPGWIIINSDIPYKKVIKTMDRIAIAYEEIARKNNKTHILLTLKTESIINFLCRKHNYSKAETNVTRLVKYIDTNRTQDGIFWYDQEGIDTYFPSSDYVSPTEK